MSLVVEVCEHLFEALAYESCLCVSYIFFNC